MTVYDADGQLLTGSYMDYALPRADDAPDVRPWSDHRRAGQDQPLGVKGCGEAGCAGSLTSVMNAVVDALSEYGIRHLDMPATPYRVWHAIREASERPGGLIRARKHNNNDAGHRASISARARASSGSCSACAWRISPATISCC